MKLFITICTCINLYLVKTTSVAYSDWYKNVWLKWINHGYLMKEVFKCRDKQLFGVSGSINSPRYPLNYPNNAECNWIINTPKEYTELHIDFKYFNVENLSWTSLCLKDFLEIYQYPDGTRQKKVRYCGKKFGRSIKLYGNHFEIRFRSNSYRTQRGFKLKWTAVKGCGGELSDDKRKITLPKSNTSEKYVFCEWKIMARNSTNQIQVDFEKLHLRHLDGSCRRSYVQILNNDGRVLSKFCSSLHVLRSLRFKEKQLRIRIKLSKKTKHDSFKFTWSSTTQKVLHTSHGACGLTYTNNHIHHRSRRLAGGRAAEQGEWPWIVQVRISVITKFHRTRYITCGGVVISPRYILTAAHCLKRKHTVILYEVFVGTISEHNMDTSNRITVDVKDIHIHSDFHALKPSGKLRNDIGLIRLPNKLHFDDHIQPICLPTNHLNHTQCEFAGWGKTHEHSLHSKRLNTIKSDLWGHCDKTDSIICATYQGQNAGACRGDSGSPLVCKQNDGRKYLVGILSHGRKKCPSPVDGYVNVFLYSDWIQKVMTSYGEGEND